MSDLMFFTNPMSRGRIVRMMLEEVGAEYATTVLEYGPEMRSSEYLAINPMAKVPAIVHRGTVVTEAAAICAYLADVYPDAGLAPPPTERGAYYRWLFFGAGPVEAAVTNATFNIDTSDPQIRGRVGYGDLASVLDTLEGVMSDREWLLGERFSAVDVYLGSQVAWGMMFGTIEKRPAFESYAARLRERPAIQRAAAKDDALMPPQGG
ncbi:glutathione S-transferase [Palleronia marisminoris]|uniref:Glutathione S-transferase GST-6.0 n=1 Tax=Palleronia marisminoris TaxID=315423 RepID=A0A1Y5SSI6_9RHOB|nr:glutathione S-transferase family protein [Palleronia marisminoris]SFG96194.1 glutathione S-transferase [Palleronia marisminoris]SLN47309.1 Glutathione S-transferase GST-6.0 [Palleronia marisminoris]